MRHRSNSPETPHRLEQGQRIAVPVRSDERRDIHVDGARGHRHVHVDDDRGRDHVRHREEHACCIGEAFVGEDRLCAVDHRSPGHGPVRAEPPVGHVGGLRPGSASSRRWQVRRDGGLRAVALQERDDSVGIVERTLDPDRRDGRLRHTTFSPYEATTWHVPATSPAGNATARCSGETGRSAQFDTHTPPCRSLAYRPLGS